MDTLGFFTSAFSFGALGGVGAGFFFGEMSKSYPIGCLFGAAIGLAAGVILRLRWVGTLIFGLAAGVAAYSLGDGAQSLLGALGFAPVGALIGAVLAFRSIKEQLKGGGDKPNFWSAP